MWGCKCIEKEQKTSNSKTTLSLSMATANLLWFQEQIKPHYFTKSSLVAENISHQYFLEDYIDKHQSNVRPQEIIIGR